MLALACQRRGSGAPFVWSHGLLGSMALEQRADFFGFETLARHCELIRYDAPGHGRSPAPAGADYCWSALAGDLLAVASHCGHRRFTAGGQSMGAATALYSALAAPESVTALVLATPPVGWQARQRRARLYGELIQILETRGSRMLAMMMRQQPQLPAWLAPLAPDYQQGAIEQLAATATQTLIAIYDGARRSQYPDPQALAGITQPCLILAWEDDPIHPVATARELAQYLPEAELAVAGTSGDIASWPARIAAFVTTHTPSANRRDGPVPNEKRR